jgi:hypothetical protein
MRTRLRVLHAFLLRNIKRSAGNCQHLSEGDKTKCYAFEPHFHEERLAQKLPRKRYFQFIFTCANGDIAFASDYQLRRILYTIRAHDDRTFLLHSKDPRRAFGRMKLPRNLLAGITLENNRDTLASQASQASPPSQRYQGFLAVQHKAKMVTIEPVLEFDLDVPVNWMTELRPVMVWLGYDSKHCGLPEPSLETVLQLHWELSLLGIPVLLKTIRGARTTTT